MFDIKVKVEAVVCGVSMTQARTVGKDEASEDSGMLPLAD